MKIIAHRGASGTYRENTIEAFQAAYEMEATSIETDVRRCPECWKLKLAHEPIRSEEECEALADFADILPYGEKMELILELKERGICKEAAIIADNLRWRDKITFSSFLWKELWRTKQTSPRSNIGLLWDQDAKNIPKYLVALAGNFLGASSIHLDIEMLKRNENLAAYFKKKHFNVYAYAVNSEPEIMFANKLNLDGIFTDYPAYASYMIFGKTGD
ncbi:MAG: hypothetical protein UW30_C0005G0015 [Candidatus Giovannonibacteria bacterium GW2011_GWA2_44_13b]|uniref:GP-PDE domain-containing protein n=2 Tax=Candidatus Giovannoniibacteriota TaxID=1752738 RepID=A0A0G1H2T9_9BACT|nr:MAG: hypothetical protein UW30_C0005G0015 [Candidatus Giovannonibacteria bacterium GW2011_GWA2_44_13b]OGF81343.1 MAG: hypothetical protein A2924_04765 [Candidatus Giovannonibacteria bacterium RIFCSPLOWO2_01_FULL_44_16]